MGNGSRAPPPRTDKVFFEFLQDDFSSAPVVVFGNCECTPGQAPGTTFPNPFFSVPCVFSMIKRYDDPAALPRRQILHFIFHSLSTIKCRDENMAKRSMNLSILIAQILGRKVVSIPACHAKDRGSIPRRGSVINKRHCPKLASSIHMVNQLHNPHFFVVVSVV